MQQTQGVQIKGRDQEEFATLTQDGSKTRLDASVAGSVSITNSSGNVITPAQDDTVVLLRRIVKLMESQAVVDIAKRQRVAIDSVTGVITTIGTALPGLSSGAGVAITNAVTANAPTQSAASTYFQPVWVGPVDQRYQIKDNARMVYDTCMRSKLAFT